MQLSLVLAFLASLFLAQADGKSDRDKIQGDWKAESMVQGGEKAPEELVKNFTLNVKDNRWMVMINGQEEKGTFKEDSSKKPKEITFTSDSGTERQGIYDLDGDTLKVCVGSPGDTRPTEFDSKSGSSAMYIVFKRKK
jgi:uncharacterized protein (TIGR03067 family)